jgi:hypothetical protein
MIWDVQPGSDLFSHSGSRIQGSKRHRIPDQDPQHWKIYLQLRIGQKNMPRKVQKPFWNAGNRVYLFILVNFYFLCSRIQIRILNTDPDTGQPECGSGSTTLLQEHIQGEWGNPKCIIAQRWRQLTLNNKEKSSKQIFSALFFFQVKLLRRYWYRGILCCSIL